MIRRFYDRARAAGLALLLLALALLAAYAMGVALDDATAAAGKTTTVAPHGDDNGDGRIDEDESGWDCATMGNRQCGPAPAPVSIALPVDCTGPGGCVVEGLPDECQGARDATVLCVTVATRPPYGWTNPDGSRVDNPDGRAQLRDLTERPGTPEFEAALRALDAEWREHH
ncbi:hypothetical protein [Streptomyces sp. NPDC004267]|uniref:hypothetical protein n=1 Tax=Streptomyces sp. NPDC004267 TaxID=3364694 RepID=UPI00368040FB